MGKYVPTEEDVETRDVYCLGDNSPWMCQVSSACLVSRRTDSLSSRLSSQECLQSKQPWKIEITCSSRAEGIFV